MQSLWINGLAHTTYEADVNQTSRAWQRIRFATGLEVEFKSGLKLPVERVISPREETYVLSPAF